MSSVPLKNILLLGHGDPTRKLLKSIRGDIGATTKFFELLSQGGYPTERVDILELFGNDIHHLYEPLAALNYTLIERGEELIEEFGLKEIEKIKQTLLAYQPEYVVIFSWLWSLMALLGTGIHKIKPTISKLFVLHEEETINSHYYEKCDFLITESLLANKKAHESGLPIGKTLFLPHYSFLNPLPPSPHKSYVENLLAQSKKPIKYTKNTLVVGSITRIEAGKNCEFALEAVKNLVEKGHDLLFILKGEVEIFSNHPPYCAWLTTILEDLKDEPWFLWDPHPSPLSEIDQVYAAMDIFIHLSGSEGGSNVVVESLCMGVPTLILEASTNPSLFNEGACFVKTSAMASSPFPHPFALPDRIDLLEKLEALLLSPELRKHWSSEGKKIATQRFSKKNALERVPLILKAAHHYHHSASSQGIEHEIEDLYYQDCALFNYTPACPKEI